MTNRNYKSEPNGNPRVGKKKNYNEKKKLLRELNGRLKMAGNSYWI